MEATTHQLTAEERQTLIDLRTGIANHKLRIYELNTQLERAQKERDATEALFAGALSMLANAHGLPGAQINPDLTVLTGAPKA